MQGMEDGHTGPGCRPLFCLWLWVDASDSLLSVICYLESVVLGLVVAGPWCHGAGGYSVVVTAPAPSTDWDWPLRGVKHQLIATTQPPPPLRSSGTHFYTSLAQ